MKRRLHPHEVHWTGDKYVKIKNQLNATEWILLQNLLSAQHVSGTIKFHTGPATCKPKVCTSYILAHALIRHFHTHTAIAQPTSGLPGSQIPADQNKSKKNTFYHL